MPAKVRKCDRAWWSLWPATRVSPAMCCGFSVRERVVIAGVQSGKRHQRQTQKFQAESVEGTPPASVPRSPMSIPKPVDHARFFKGFGDGRRCGRQDSLRGFLDSEAGTSKGGSPGKKTEKRRLLWRRR